MLAYILAIAVGFGSFAVYMAAFFFPEVHRKEDFLWSGVGLFYALVLWVCASRITGGVLLGQLAGVSLLGWFGWETLSLRRAIAQPEDRTALEGSLRSALQELFSQILAPLQRKSQPKVLQTATIVTESEEIAEPTSLEATLEAASREVAVVETSELEGEITPTPETASTAELEVEVTPTPETASTAELEVEVTSTQEIASTAESEVEVTSTEEEIGSSEVVPTTKIAEMAEPDETESEQDKIT